MLNGLLFNEKFFNERCGAYILNLIVQDSLRITHDALYKIRQSVHYFRASEARTRLFFQCVRQEWDRYINWVETGLCY